MAVTRSRDAVLAGYVSAVASDERPSNCFPPMLAAADL
jgi:hypothetical protein